MRLCLGRNYIEWEPFHQRGRRNRQWRQTGMYFQQSVSFFLHCFPSSLPLSFLVSIPTSFTSFLSCLLSLDVDLWLACLTLQTNLGGTILDAVTSSKVELSQGKGGRWWRKLLQVEAQYQIWPYSSFNRKVWLLYLFSGSYRNWPNPGSSSVQKVLGGWAFSVWKDYSQNIQMLIHTWLIILWSKNSISFVIKRTKKNVFN